MAATNFEAMNWRGDRLYSTPARRSRWSVAAACGSDTQPPRVVHEVAWISGQARRKPIGGPVQELAILGGHRRERSSTPARTSSPTKPPKHEADQQRRHQISILTILRMTKPPTSCSTIITNEEDPPQQSGVDRTRGLGLQVRAARTGSPNGSQRDDASLQDPLRRERADLALHLELPAEWCRTAATGSRQGCRTDLLRDHGRRDHEIHLLGLDALAEVVERVLEPRAETLLTQQQRELLAERSASAPRPSTASPLVKVAPARMAPAIWASASGSASLMRLARRSCQATRTPSAAAAGARGHRRSRRTSGSGWPNSHSAIGTPASTSDIPGEQALGVARTGKAASGSTRRWSRSRPSSSSRPDRAGGRAAR